MFTIDGIWQQIIRNKYLGTKALVHVQWKSGDSYFWANLIKVKWNFLRFRTIIRNDESQVKFWKNIWLGNRSLWDQYPQLYNIVRKKQNTMAEELRTQFTNLSWRRDLIGNKLAMWNNLASRLPTVELSQKRWFQMKFRPTRCFYSKITLSETNPSRHS